MRKIIPANSDGFTAITNAHIIDGERVIQEQTVVIKGVHILAVGGLLPAGATVLDAHSATLLPSARQTGNQNDK